MEIYNFLEEINELVYVVDVEKNELEFLNKIARRQLGIEDYLDKKCYRVLYGAEQPCEFCPRKYLERDQYYIRRVKNIDASESFLLKDKLVKWKGKLCQMHMQTNIDCVPEENNILNTDSLETVLLGVERGTIYQIPNRAKVDFLSRISHEIRTPMNAIMGMTNIAKNVISDEEKAMECLDKIDVSTKYLLSIVNDILDMFRIEEGKIELGKEAFSLKELLKELKDIFQVLVKGKEIELSFQVLLQHDKILGDKARLSQILFNIVGNALKFTPKGGKIIITMQEITQTEHTEEVKVKFSVKDNGMGIDEKNLARIFKSFEQVESNLVNQYGGTGLGLAISSNLVHLMGGNLEVTSEKGKGSEFFFTIAFPINTEERLDEAMQETQAAQEEEYDFTGKRLLLVEDNELNIEIAQTLLEMVGFEVDVAQNGKLAVDKFNETEPGRYDAILMDIRMPVMDGLEATRRIRTLGKVDSSTVSIVALSANAYDEDMRMSIANGMNGHVAKPIEVDNLYRVLHQLVM